MIISANADAFSQMRKTFSRDVYSNYSTYNLLPTLSKKLERRRTILLKVKVFICTAKWHLISSSIDDKHLSMT